MDRFDRFKKPGLNRQAAVKALKESVQTGHKTGLPPNLLVLFAPRTAGNASELKKAKINLPYTGIAAYVKDFASEGDPEYQPPRAEDRPPSPRLFRNREFPTQARIDTETKVEKQLRLGKWRAEELEREMKERVRAYDPNKDPKIEGDPYKTIIVSRLSYDVTDKKLRREFEEYGPIKRIRVVTDKAGKPRGYAFVEYEHKADMKEAYKAADGRKIEGRRVLVDVERGRTVENWRPRRLGGGLGAPGREPKQPKKPKPGTGLPVAPVAAPVVDERARGGHYSPPRRAEPSRYEPRSSGPPSGYRGGGGDYRSGGDYRGSDRSDPRDYRKRDREPSPRRDDDKRPRRDLEDGELRDDRRERDRDRDRDRDYRPRRERDMV